MLSFTINFKAVLTSHAFEKCPFSLALLSSPSACYYVNCGYTSDFLFSDECPDASTSPRRFSATPLATAEGTGAFLILAGATSNVLRQLFFR